MKYMILAGQSLADIALRVYGSADGAIVLAEENGLEVTDVLEPGRMLEYSPEKVVNKGIVQYYAAQNVRPSTALEGRVFDDTFDLSFN